MPSEGVKFDGDKVDLSLLLSLNDALSEVARLMEYGAKKYSRDNWKKVPEGYTRYTAALMRHLMTEPGEVDFESDIPHDVAVAANALFRLQLRLEGLSEADY